MAYGLFVLAAAGAVYGFVTVAKEGELRRRCTPTCLLHPQYAAADRKVPDFTLTDAKGAKVDIASYRGKTVVLNFWTRTCGPCLEEMPQIAELTHILANQPDVAVVTVSTDEGPDAVKDVLKSVIKESPPPFEVLFDPDGDEVVDKKFGTHLFPETWIIDPRGVVRARFDGEPRVGHPGGGRVHRADPRGRLLPGRDRRRSHHRRRRASLHRRDLTDLCGRSDGGRGSGAGSGSSPPQ